MNSTFPTRPVRIMSISGSPSDRRDALSKNAASNEPIDVFVGDWMSELNMPRRAYEIHNGTGPGYEVTFIEALEPALEHLAAKRSKLVANAGSVSTKALFDKVVSMAASFDLSVAWVEGDVVLDTVRSMRASGSKLTHITTGQDLDDWPHEPIFAQCYLGGQAIAKALNTADIVLCGRVADASPIVGAAVWWHGWDRTDFDKLAQSLIAGHLIECSTYVTGGDFSGFKSLDFSTIHDMGYPIAEIARDGDVIITKREESGGLVSVETCKEQLLYEIQGSYYLNCDVTAVISQAKFTQVGKDRVRLSGVTGLPPPPTTKVGLTAHGGYTAELHWAVVGLDVKEKAKMLEILLRHSIGDQRLSKMTKFELTVYGSVAENPRSQDSATVDLRLVAQARDKDALSMRNFGRPVFDVIMQTYPAATMHPDRRTGDATPFQEYFPTLIPQPTTIVHFSKPGMKSLVVQPPELTMEPPQQPSHETIDPVPLGSFGPTAPAPLGYVVMARAGDKGSNCNVGFFVRHESEWPWLRSLLSTKTFINLMGDDFKGQRIDRMEFPHLWAVHFLLHDHLDRGVCANTTYDVLGKFLAEYIRCKTVEIPNSFLDKGRI